MENKELMTNEEFNTMDVYESNENTGSSAGGILKVAAVAVAVAGGVAIYLHKTKAKREAKKIEKLKKKGYVILTPEEVAESEIVEVEDEK